MRDSTQGWRAESSRPTRRRTPCRRQPLRGGSVPPVGQSRVGGTGAHCAPLRGGTHSPSYCNSKWVEAVWRDPAFTRAARPKGKGVDSQEGENRRCSPSCAQCGRVGRIPGRDARAVRLRLSRRIPMEWRAEVVAQTSFSWTCGPIHLLAPYGVVSHAQGGGHLT